MKPTGMPKPILIAFLSVEAAFYAAFLTLDFLGRGDETYGFKYGGILLCLIFACLCALRGGDKLTAAALALTAAADRFLLLRGDHLTLGVALFICVQGLYALRLHRSGKGCGWLLRGSLALVFLSLLFLLRLGSLRNALAVFCFSQLAANAVLSWHSPALHWFSLGLTLFIGCDICVGLFNALPPSSAAHSVAYVGIWLLYLPSQVLIALSAAPQRETLP